MTECDMCCFRIVRLLRVKIYLRPAFQTRFLVAPPPNPPAYWVPGISESILRFTGPFNDLRSVSTHLLIKKVITGLV